MRRRRLIALLASIAFVALGAGCGAEDFANDPRPPAPIQLSARIADDNVLFSPKKIGGEPIGGGIANVTISNQTDHEVALTFVGPADRSTGPIIPRGVAEFKLDLLEGEYTLEADDPSIRSTAFVVGPERPTASNDLLLP